MSLKKVVAIVRMEKVDALKTAMSKEGFAGMTVTPVRGTCSNTRTLCWRGRQYVEHFLPKVKFEVAVADETQKDRLIEIILGTARTGEEGDGIIYIEPFEEAVRIRDGVRGNVALTVARIVSMLSRKEKGVLEEFEHEQA
ncbi:MAG: P-II family nitrogen regulator [Candidatus Brocadiales bacterium]